MNSYAYSAVDSQGTETRGTLQVADQSEALQRIKEMGFFPVKISLVAPTPNPAARAKRHLNRLGLKSRAATRPALVGGRERIKPKRLAVFTRQLATLVEAGMPLLRGLHLLQEQETYAPLKRVIAGLGLAIEGGETFSEALSRHPRTFDRLFINMVKAGELGGALELALQRLAEFMEKANKLRRKVKAAMVYPAAVLTVATGVMALMMLFVIPRFKEVFMDLGGGRPLPAFTRFVLGISETVQHRFLPGVVLAILLVITFRVWVNTATGRRMFDRFKLRMPGVGPVLRKVSIARFTRTLGTLLGSGVPILQSLAIVKEATGNAIVSAIVGTVHESVKQGESIAAPLRNSGVFPVMVAGLVDVGEQTGAVPEMLNKIADNYDEEVDTAVAAMTSLLEPFMIVFLAVVVGSIVIAMFLPLIPSDTTGTGQPGDLGI